MLARLMNQTIHPSAAIQSAVQHFSAEHLYGPCLLGSAVAALFSRSHNVVAASLIGANPSAAAQLNLLQYVGKGWQHWFAVHLPNAHSTSAGEDNGSHRFALQV